MDKFSNLNQKNTEETGEKYLLDNKFLKVVEYDDYTFVKESDMVVILPYFKDEGYIYLRSEYIPTYKYRYQNDPVWNKYTNFLTIISGTIEKGETPEQTVRRELYEESGIVLSSMYQIIVDKGLFVSKGNTAKYFPCLLELRYNDYRLTQPKTDGSESEKKSKMLKINLGYIDELLVQDTITQLLLNKLKSEYNIK
jgi:8-oxo-dGTP pyrophosphatase MutT (NUDIX family)